jgi:hypothetical protein
MQRELTEREKWLIERIGKVVYRPDTKCTCEICKNVYLNGLIVADRDHAIYLSEMEFESTMDGTPMQYFDSRQEAIDFENENND